MVHYPVRLVRIFGAVLVFCMILPFALSGQKPAPAEQGSKPVSLTVGETTHVPGPPDYFERVLLTPPDEEKMSIGATWEISPEVAIMLGLLKGEQKVERWRAIRRNLGLSLDESEDLILWTEVADAILDRIGTLSLPKNPLEEPTFGLQVEFPGKETANAQAAVSLTFGKEFDGSLNKEIADLLTGVEGFVNIVTSDGKAAKDKAIVEKALRSTKLRLMDTHGQAYSASPDGHGYFHFEHLPVDRNLGSDYWLEAAIEEDKSLLKFQGPEKKYVPVRQGVRTRVLLTAVLPRKDSETEVRSGSLAIPEAPAPISMMLEQFVGGNFLLSAIMQRLPANPGLHLGVVQIDGSGLQPLWSARFRLQPPTIDRRPHFVSKGMFRLQCLTATNPEGLAYPHFVKIMWIARAEAAQLDLQARSVRETPWGIGMGVVPSVNPALYAVGASYKLFSPVEVFAGAGIRKGHPTSFVYGLTLDIEDILTALFGEAPAKSDKKSDAAAADGQKADASGTTPVPAKSKKK